MGPQVGANRGDLDVTPISDALEGRRIDLVVSGSIAAVESVRFIRALRRLGAQVTPWLTKGGAQFVTPLALEWAAANPCIESFSGTASHIFTGDAVAVAPASSNIINRIARGVTDSPTTALIQSALGQKKPVFIMPAMHDSLAHAPAHIEHIGAISQWPGVHFLSPREEEGKKKFPEPAVVADQLAHVLNSFNKHPEPILLTMGTTRGYIDDVRYVSNYSSGKLGSVIAEELFRQGFKTHIVCGPCEFKPANATTFVPCATTTEMLNACLAAEKSGLSAGIFCASVLDYEPTSKTSGKIRSSQNELQISLHPTKKIIGEVKLAGKPKIGFKLEIGLDAEQACAIGKRYAATYGLAALVANDLNGVNAQSHHAWIVQNGAVATQCSSKQEIARWLARNLLP